MTKKKTELHFQFHGLRGRVLFQYQKVQVQNNPFLKNNNSNEMDETYCSFALNLISFYKRCLQIYPFIKRALIKREKLKRGTGQKEPFQKLDERVLKRERGLS